MTRTSFSIRFVCLPVVLGAFFLLVSSAAAVTGPRWEIDSLANSTVAAGGQLDYLLQVENLGGADTEGEVTLTATLPVGVTGVAFISGEGASFGCVGDGPGGPPGVEGASVVTCTAPVSVHAHRRFTGTLRVRVAGSAAASVVSVFSVSGAGGGSASTLDPTRVTGAAPVFGVDAFDGEVSDEAGVPFTQAGGHPYSASTALDFESETNANPLIGEVWPVQATKDVTVELPAGFVGDPTVAERCTAVQLAGSSGNFIPVINCPSESQVGTVRLRVNMSGAAYSVGPIAVYNMVAPPNVAARFGFNVLGTVVTLDGSVRSDSDYGVTISARDISEGLDIVGSTFTFWGVPADASHDNERACPGVPGPFDPSFVGPSCASHALPRSFLRNPTGCTGETSGLTTTVRVDSWAEPDVVRESHFTSHLAPGYPHPPSEWGAPQGPTGCTKVPFTPTLTATPSTPAQAGAPSGFSFDLAVPQTSDPNTIGQADLKKTVVTLPRGVRLSGAGATGLGACTPAQIGFIGGGFPAPNPIHFNTAEPACPSSSRLGSVKIITPLLETPLSGSVYLATPHENPFGSLVAVYLVVKGPGFFVKLPGKVELDPSTGQITTTFDNNPQLPFSDLRLDLDGGTRAPLSLPSACGTYTTTSTMTSWSGASVTSNSSFTVGEGENGTPCPAPSFAPGFLAQSENPVAGGFSPFDLRLSRNDTDGEFASLSSLTLPAGMLANVASVGARCTIAQADAAACPASTRIGSVTVGAGAGPSPFYLGGDVYLTDSYKGAPFGVAVIVHAVAGPFDLGWVVVKGAIQIHDDGSATVLTDPFPTILQGIPLQIRDVRVSLDRPGFTFNPTSCNPLQVGGLLAATQGQSVALDSRFQVGGCAALSFKPVFTVSTAGKTSKASGASLHVHLATHEGPTSPSAPGESNIAKVDVQLPVVLPARLPTLQKACTDTQFAKDPAGCPEGSFVGTAVAHTPILASPLSGPAILVSHGGQAFPDLVLILQGEGVQIDLTGHTQIKKGITYSRFETVPDAPVSSFDLTLPAGPHGVLTTDVPGRNLCTNTKTVTVTKRVTRRVHGHSRKVTVKARKVVAAPLLMPTTITAQNGMVLTQTTKIAVTGCVKHKAPKAKRAGKGGGKR